MSAPQPNNKTVNACHAAVIVFTGSGTIKDTLGDYGQFFEAEVQDDTVHAMIVDPRYNYKDIANYVVELGGAIYVPAPPST